MAMENHPAIGYPCRDCGAPVRFERLRAWAKENLTEDQRRQYFDIVANGTCGPYEPPTYAQQMNLLRYECKVLRAQLAQLSAAVARMADDEKEDD